MQVEAVWEDGVLRPIRPLELAEHQRVTVEVLDPDSIVPSPETDPALLESIRMQLRDSGPAPGIEEVRRRLAKIPGSLTEDFIAERGKR
jgi:predicted DNA-binding antitoxin AbrB/MazE fold protein